MNLVSSLRRSPRHPLSRPAALALLAVVSAIATGCISHAAPAPTESPAPRVLASEAHRSEGRLEVADRTAYTLEDAVAKGRLALEKGSLAELQGTAQLIAPFGPDSRRWHAEDQARVGRLAILLGLGSGVEECITSGADNLDAARPRIRNVLYEGESTLVYAANARLGRAKPDLPPTRLSTALGLFTNPRDPRRYVDQLHFVRVRGGDASKQAEIERDAQAVIFDFLGAWIRGESTTESLQDLVQTASLAEYRGFRLALPLVSSDPDILAVHLLTTALRDLGQDI